MKDNKILNIILQIIIGFLLADIFTGIFHWIEDTYLDYCINTPFLNTIARDNELHHYFPRGIISYSYYENMEITFPIVVILLILLFIMNKKLMYEYRYFVITF